MRKCPATLVVLTMAAALGVVGVQAAAAAAAPAPGVSCPEGTYAPLVGITHYDDGGLGYRYRIGQEIHEVPIAPAGFNPATAANAMLARYGLPERPAATDVAGMQRWHGLLDGWKRNTDASLCVGTERKYHQFMPATRAAVAGTDEATTYSVQSINWAGYVADAGAGTTTYIAAQGDFVHPTLHSPNCSPNEEGSWTGIGGYHSGRLIQAGTEMSTNRAWYEYLGNNGAGIAPVYTINVHPGDRIHTYEVIQRSTGQTTFYVYDTATGVNKSVVLTLSVSTYYDGSSTAYIDEMPNPNVNYLRNFGSIAWTNAQAQRTSGTWYTLQSQNEVEVILVYGGITNAHPGAMTGSKTFTEHWYHC